MSLALILIALITSSCSPSNSANKKEASMTKVSDQQPEVTTTNVNIEAGKKIYMANCIACHGPTGLGDGPAARAMPKNKPRNLVTDNFKNGSSRANIISTLVKGIPDTPMPSWKHLNKNDLNAITDYILTLRKK